MHAQHHEDRAVISSSGQMRMVVEDFPLEVTLFTVNLSTFSRGVTIHLPHNTIRIVILTSRYDTYGDTFNLFILLIN